MEKRTITLVVVLFGLIVAGMFIFAYLKKSEIETPLPVDNSTSEQTDPYANITRITAKHFFTDNKHTFVGELELPTPCDLIDVQSEVRESFPEQVNLMFTVINNSDSCLEKPTTQRFLVEAVASGEAEVSATFMGRAIELNLIPALEGETPEEFEIFIKG